MKLVLKGIETREDARLCVEHGVDGILVSNHGGRATETYRATIECLPEVVDGVAGRIPVMVDGAHAFSHFPYKLSDLNCDYYGVSLHKWTCAPVGTGFLYVKKDRIAQTWSLMSSDAKQVNDIRKFEEIGTHPAANPNAISEALVFSENIGVPRKAARLRYLRDRWAHRLQENPKVRILHSENPELSCGIGFISLTPSFSYSSVRRRPST